MKKMKILGIGLDGGSAQYRLWQIAKYFRKNGHEFVCASYKIGFPKRVAGICDIIVLEMMRNKSTVDKIKKLGKKIVYDADDLIHEARRDGSQGVEDKGTPEKNAEIEKLILTPPDPLSESLVTDPKAVAKLKEVEMKKGDFKVEF